MYYDIVIETGCNDCGRLGTWSPPMHSQFYDSQFYERAKYICSDCYEKHYSPEAIRNKELNKLLFKWWHFWKWGIWKLPKRFLNYVGLII